jgi:hypothetical protein
MAEAQTNEKDIEGYRMEPAESARSARTAPESRANAASPAKPVPQELVEAVAERVYAMLLLELKLENERRPANPEPGDRNGGSLYV